MSVVVNFLSTLVSDESNGSIKRMLTLCAELERISKSVIDKTEKESHTKKKRKVGPEQVAAENASQLQPDGENQPSSSSPSSRNVGMLPTSTPTSTFTSSLAATGNDMMNTFADGSAGSGPDQEALNLPSNVQGLADFGQSLPDMLNPANMANPGLSDQVPFSTMGTTSPSTAASFQQPFVPQDLWQIPMPLEWEWPEMSTGF